MGKADIPPSKPYKSGNIAATVSQQPASRTGRDLLLRFLDAARRNEAGAIAGADPEFLHQYRVALRRLRSGLSLWKGVFAAPEVDALKAEFSDLMQETGALRDLDVFAAAQEDYTSLLPDTLRPGLDLMFRDIAEHRRNEQAALSARLQDPEHADRVQHLVAAIRALPAGPRGRQPAGKLARRLISRRYGKLVAVARMVDKDTPDRKIHELRIHMKKLRYLLDMFKPLVPGSDLKSVRKPLQDLQERLGLFNDASVQQVALRAYPAAYPGRDAGQSAEMAMAAGGLIAMLHLRQQEERVRCEIELAAFTSKQVRRRFEGLART